MKREHCSCRGFNVEFKPPNFSDNSASTTPKIEWEIVEEGKLPQKYQNEGRKVLNVDNLLKLDIVEKAGLKRFEVVAVMLYTGPMVST
jgi:hypothetical protein